MSTNAEVVATPATAPTLANVQCELHTFVLCALAAGTAICGAATSIVALIFGRVLPGVGAGVFPVAFGIVREEFPADRVATGVVLISAVLGAAGGLGIVLAEPAVS